MIQKRILASALALILAASAMTACQKKENVDSTASDVLLPDGLIGDDLFADSAHEHEPTSRLRANVTEHWWECVCGGQAQLGEHSFDDLGKCVECGAMIEVLDDGYTGVYITDGDGFETYRAVCHPLGFIEVCKEAVYTVRDDGTKYISELTTVTIPEIVMEKFDADGSITERTTCDNNRVVTLHEAYEYTMGSDGGKYISGCTVTDYTEGTLTDTEYDESGNIVNETVSELK